MASFQSPEQRERRVATSAATASGSEVDASVVVVKGEEGGGIGRRRAAAAEAERRLRATRNMVGRRGETSITGDCGFWNRLVLKQSHPAIVLPPGPVTAL
jgi:hypothetical protein